MSGVGDEPTLERKCVALEQKESNDEWCLCLVWEMRPALERKGGRSNDEWCLCLVCEMRSTLERKGGRSNDEWCLCLVWEMRPTLERKGGRSNDEWCLCQMTRNQLWSGRMAGPTMSGVCVWCGR